MNFLRQLVWNYFFLLLFEGALRKWILPSLSVELLLIRDPVVLLIYFQAIRQGLFFGGFLNNANYVLAVATILTATAFGYANFLVTIYGFLANNLQIPLIFLIPQILTRDDLLGMGKVLLWVAPPMALLVAFQFRSDPGSVWNLGAMGTHYGTVRPTGTFSFSNGLAYYYALVAAFLFYGYIQAKTYNIWLLATVTAFTMLAAGCSGSRTFIVSIGLVLITSILCTVLRGRGGFGLIVATVVIAVLASVLSSLDFMSQATGQLEARFADAGAVEGGSGGFFARYFSELFGAFEIIPDIPFFGYGLGSGTNGAGALYDYTQVSQDFPWVEDEWQRLVEECGPVFGLGLCAFRLLLTLHVARAAFRAFLRNNFLPAVLFAACGQIILNGQWGGAVPLGFAIFGAGLVLTACQEPEDEDDEDEPEEDEYLYDEHEEPSSAHDAA
jgi:hypothetical protein